MGLISWILNLFDDTPARSHVTYATGSANGGDLKWAMKKARDGFKLRRIGWGADCTEYMVYDKDRKLFVGRDQDDAYIWGVPENQFEMVLLNNRPADAASCDWYVAGKAVTDD